ncbi:MAG: DUF2207 domain-containing protein [Dehalococcoidia bacterium]
MTTRRHLRLPLVLAALLASLAVLAGARTVLAQSGERVTSYRIDARIEADGGVLFQETITYDFGSNDRHGIDRNVITSQYYDDRNDREYPLEVISVTSPSPDTPVQYDLTGFGDLTRIRIGDPDETISGTHTYVITYRLEGTLNAFDDHDEFYWNIIGDQWDVPIQRVEVAVRAPAPPTRMLCFAGPFGSSELCAASDIQGDVATFSGSLDANEAFTVVIGLPKGAVSPAPAPILHERWSFSRAFAWDMRRTAPAVLLLFAVFLGLSRLIYGIGRDRQAVGQVVAAIPAPAGAAEEPVPLFHGTVTPTEYLPPEGMRPGLVGTLEDEVAHPLDVTASIIDLAARGYLRIEETEEGGWFSSADWKLTRLKPSQGLAEFEALLLDGLFEDGDEVRLSDLKTKFASRMSKVQSALYGEMVARGWYRRSPKATREMWLGIGVGMLVASVVLVVVAAIFTTFALIPVPLVIGSFLFLLLHNRMPARTGTGTAAYRRVLGFRRFIVEAETRRAQFAEQAGLFYEYLPYAIVFGATKEWARAFEGLDLPQPDWYVS